MSEPTLVPEPHYYASGATYTWQLRAGPNRVVNVVTVYPEAADLAWMEATVKRLADSDGVVARLIAACRGLLDATSDCGYDCRQSDIMAARKEAASALALIPPEAA